MHPLGGSHRKVRNLANDRSSLQQLLSNLYSIESSTLLDLVTTYKETKVLLPFERNVSPDPPHVHIIVVCGVEGHRKAIIGPALISLQV
jgi:hypothetical protein